MSVILRLQRLLGQYSPPGVSTSRSVTLCLQPVLQGQLLSGSLFLKRRLLSAYSPTSRSIVLPLQPLLLGQLLNLQPLLKGQ